MDQFQHGVVALDVTMYRVLINDGSGWSGNALRFASELEAEAYAKNLASRWTAVKAWTVVGVTADPTAYRPDGSPVI